MLPEISVCPAQVTESSHQPSLEYLKQMRNEVQPGGLKLTYPCDTILTNFHSRP